MTSPRLTSGALMLRGRRDECAVLDRLLVAARAGRSGALVLRGEPGTGKSALLDHAIAGAADLQVVRVTGVASERELAFAALHQLCAPMFDRLDRLPGPQRDALATAFGVSAGVVPERLLVGVAVLSLLSEAAEDRPLMCVVDDARWLDPASVQTLGFVARRLSARPVVLLIAARHPGEELRGLPELVVEGLREADARALLDSVVPWRLDERVREQIVAETRGNPSAVLQLPRVLTRAQLAGEFGLPAALSLEGRLEDGRVPRLGALPQDTQRLLLLAAAEPTGDPALFTRAAARLGIGGAALRPAESAELLEIGARLRFRDLSVRSAVYRAASPEERRRAHRALAEATDAAIDPDRRARHLAQATAGPDEDVAAELERTVGRAQARGGLAAAAAFSKRATMLTVEPSRRAERAYAAAQTNYEAGCFDDALALAATAEGGGGDHVHQARIHLLRAQIAFASHRGSDAPPLLLRAARDLEAVDPNLVRATYLEALAAAVFAGRLARGVGVVEVSKAVQAGPPSPDPPRPSELLLQGLATRFTEGYAAAASILKQALSAFRRETALPADESRWLWLASAVAADLWDDETEKLLSMRGLERARETGAVTATALLLGTGSIVHAISGELARVASMVEETGAVTHATGAATISYGALWLAAVRGREGELSELITTTVGDAVQRGEGLALAVAEHARAMLYNGLGRYDAALAAVRDAGERSSELGSPTRAVAELIEAAVRCRRLSLAQGALERLAETARASGTDWALGVEARSRALLSDGDAAEELYREAIERLARTGVRVELARAHLLYGEWLRRQRRRLDAREQLRTAREMFMMIGADAFVARAERELLSTGERARKRSIETREDLTAREAQIARLARDGVSNPEIGARLFISPRTVEYHLHKVFHKLGITSRHELEGVLPREPVSALAA